MPTKNFNIWLTGVGGQGIGLLSEIILRAADHSGQPVKGVDTHGLAQRGGIVISQIRIGKDVHSPLIQAGQADLVVALERHEALRAALTVLKAGGALAYYNTVWQPLPVRLGQRKEIDEKTVQRECTNRQIKVYQAFNPDLPEARMQNIVILKILAQKKLIPKIDKPHYESAMNDLLSGDMLKKNMHLFREHTSSHAPGTKDKIQS